jgi:hypothetical protein
MTEEEFLKQYERYLLGKLGTEEIKALHAYQDGMSLEANDMDEAERSQIRGEILSKLTGNINAVTSYRVKRSPARIWWAVAALVTGISIGIVYMLQPRQGGIQQTEGRSVAFNQPADQRLKKTWLTLSNGKMISLSDAGKGLVTASAGIKASKRSDNELSYSQHAAAGSVPDTNSVATPAGEQFSIILADGSRVRLNAGSSLRYPVFFTGRREVYLTGEGCFEVSADPSNPFTVHVNGESVNALGTLFNIKAYAEEKVAKVTLVAGAVNVNTGGGTHSLHIGQQLNYQPGENTYWLKDVNTDIVIAWREGYFAFDKESITGIMAEIGRWYNMQVTFVSGNANRKFSGKIIRYATITDVLKRLEMTGAMKFSIQQNKIMVTIPE